MAEIKIAVSDSEILACFKAVFELRPHLDKENYLKQVKEMQQETYTLAYIKDGENVIAIAGFRYLQMLYCGKIIYIDDLSTLPESRGKGYASQLLDFIFNLAMEKNLEAVHLDSGYQRFDAHKLYFNKGFIINAYHFSKKLK